MPYEIQNGRVRFNGKAVRNANADTFVVLRDDWGKDGSSVYRRGRKVARADPDTFSAWSSQTGGDSTFLFYVSCDSGEMVHAARPDEVDGAARVFEADGLTFFAGRDLLWVGGNYGLLRGPVPLTTRSLLALGQRYLKDDERVYWFSDHGAPQEVVADAATFTVDANGASDRGGRFVNGVRDEATSEVQRETEPARAADELVRSLWAELVPRWFALFDGTLPNDEPVWSSPRPPAVRTEVPVHELHIAGGTIVLTAAGRTMRGRVSAMELLAGWLFGVARGKNLGDATVIPILPRADGLIAAREGSPPAWERTLDLAYLLERSGAHDEARFLTRAVLRAFRFAAAANEPGARARAQKLLPALVAALPPEVHAQGTRTQAAAKWMIDEGLHLSADALVRQDVAAELRDVVNATDTAIARLFDVCAPLLALLDDPEPAVASKAAVSFELLCSKLFHAQDYEVALALADRLAACRYNLDVQSARRWECLAAVGRDDEAEAAWASVLALTRPDERAPRQHVGLHTDYPSFEIWRAFGELRLAQAHAWSAEGQHPSRELRKRRLGPPDGAEVWRARAVARVTAVGERLRGWIGSMPARTLGPALAELAEEIARTTGQGKIQQPGFVMRKQYVEYRRYAAPYTYERAYIEASGEFDEVAPKRFVLREQTTRVIAALGRAFGLEYRFVGTKVGRVLPAKIQVTRPDGASERTDVYETSIYLGLREQFVWLFEREDELVAGRWIVAIELFDGVSEKSFPVHTPPVAKERIARLERAFDVTLG